MRRWSILMGAILWLTSSLALAVDGLVVVPSSRSVAATLDRLQATVEQRGLTVFARIDHAAGAACR